MKIIETMGIQNLSGCYVTIFRPVGPSIMLESIMDTSGIFGRLLGQLTRWRMDELGVDSVPAPKRAREVAAKEEHATANGSGGEAGRYSGEEQWLGSGLEAREPARARIQRASGREAERPARRLMSRCRGRNRQRLTANEHGGRGCRSSGGAVETGRQLGIWEVAKWSEGREEAPFYRSGRESRPQEGADWRRLQWRRKEGRSERGTVGQRRKTTGGWAGRRGGPGAEGGRQCRWAGDERRDGPWCGGGPEKGRPKQAAWKEGRRKTGLDMAQGGGMIYFQFLCLENSVRCFYCVIIIFGALKIQVKHEDVLDYG